MAIDSFLEIAGLLRDFDPGMISGITHGSKAPTLPDRSPNNAHATQGTDGQRAVYLTNELLGAPVLRFSAASKQRYAFSGVSLSNFTLVALVKTSNDHMILGSSSANHQLRLGQGGSNVLSAFDSTSNPTSSTLGVPRSQWAINIIQRSGSTINFYQAGSDGTITSYGSGTIAGSLSIDTVFGLPIADVGYGEGDLARLGLWSVAFTEQNREDVVAFLHAIYLADHPPPSVSGSYPQAVLAAEPRLYYRLNELSGTALLDSSGHQVHGAYSGAVTRGQQGLIHNDADTSVLFGVDGRAKSAQPGYLVGSTYSVECWFYLDGEQSGDRPLLSRIHAGGVADFTLGVLDNSVVRWGVYSPTGVGAYLGPTAVIACPERKQHVVATFDGTYARLWLQGQLAGEYEYTHAFNADVGVLTIGHADYTFSGVHHYFRGVIDEVAYYDYVLPGAVIQQHYFLGAGTHIPCADPDTPSLDVDREVRIATSPCDAIIGISWEPEEGAITYVGEARRVKDEHGNPLTESQSPWFRIFEGVTVTYYGLDKATFGSGVWMIRVAPTF